MRIKEIKKKVEILIFEACSKNKFCVYLGGEHEDTLIKTLTSKKKAEKLKSSLETLLNSDEWD